MSRSPQIASLLYRTCRGAGSRIPAALFVATICSNLMSSPVPKARSALGIKHAVLETAVGTEGRSAPVLPAGYVGDQTCRSCHARIFYTYSHTAHYRASRLATKDSIAGTFKGTSIVRTSNPDLYFRLEAKKTGFYQTAVFGRPPFVATHTERFDLVIGSATKGQTYLFWRGNELFQLPISHWSATDQWINSPGPGYRDGSANFNRAIPPECLECHATYFDLIPSAPPENHFRRDNFILGIACEKCHGAGAAHVVNHRGAPGMGMVAPIVNPAKLPRARQIDLCAQCHGGLGEDIAPAFSYPPGAPLRNYIQLTQPRVGEAVDVHGNQVALLERSLCYRSAKSLTCTTCHDVHAPEHQAAWYSFRCLSCHVVQNCGMFGKRGASIAANCVDCHMPLQDSNVIVSVTNGEQTRAQVRNHWIKVYPVAPRE